MTNINNLNSFEHKIKDTLLNQRNVYTAEVGLVKMFKTIKEQNDNSNKTILEFENEISTCNEEVLESYSKGR